MEMSFRSMNVFEKWLLKNHQTSSGIWVRLYRKDSAVRTISTADLIDVLLCYGWITGPAKKGTENSILWWICPRKENSSWSALNIRYAKRLIKEGRMSPAGMGEIRKAKANGYWK